jgi:mannosylfructose-phosphate synthase
VKKNIKRICLLSTHGYVDPVPQLGRTDTGGQVVYVLELAKALARQGYLSDIYTRWFEPEKKQIDPVPGADHVRVIRIEAGEWEFIPKENIYDILPVLASNMAAFIDANGLDYILYHGHYVDAGIVTLAVAERYHRPVFFTAHSLGAWKREQMGGDPVEMEDKFHFNHRIREENKIFHNARGLTVTSQLQKEKLRQLYRYDSDNIAIIPPGVDVRRYHPAGTEEKKIKTVLPEKYIYYLSRIDDTKGHDVLLYAFDLVRKEIPGIHLVIGGGSPKPKEREMKVIDMMRRIIAEKHMEASVHILGYVPDEMMVPYYRQAQLFVLPSRFEPFGMTTSEAMACGKAVVASKYGGIKNVITHGKNGLLVDPADANEFAGALIWLLKNDGMRERMGLAASQLIYEDYSWDAIAARHIRFYNKYL